MISHFLVRDFLSNKLNWIIFTIITLIGLMLTMVNVKMFYGLGYIYFLLAITPIQSLAGVTWRSQHVMSRSYLLSLPVSRDKMFMLIQIRAIVFTVPLILYALVAPFISDDFGSVISLSYACYPLYVPLVFLAMVWMINSSLSTTLSYERITSYLTKTSRAMAWIGTLATFLFELAIVLSCFILAGEKPGLLFVAPLIVAAITAHRYYRTRQTWLSR